MTRLVAFVLIVCALLVGVQVGLRDGRRLEREAMAHYLAALAVPRVRDKPAEISERLRLAFGAACDPVNLESSLWAMELAKASVGKDATKVGITPWYQGAAAFNAGAESFRLAACLLWLTRRN